MSDLQKINSAVVKKHPYAIHIDAKLSLIQRRLSNVLLFHAYENLLSEKVHEIDISTLCTFIGFEGRNRGHLKSALKGLTTIPIEWNILSNTGEEEWGVSSLLASAEMKKGICTYEYSTALAKGLYNPDMYARINLAVQRKITSGHTLALYENCFRFIGVKSTGWWTLDEFRKLLGVENLKYANNIKSLNQKIIKPAVIEINSVSNILIEPEYLKEKRRVVAIRFSVLSNPQMSLLDMEEQDIINQTTAYKRLIEKGISKILSRQWIIEYGEEYILEKLDHTDTMEGAGRIKSTASGFLKTAIESDYKSEEIEKKKLRKKSEEDQKIRDKKTKEFDALSSKLRSLEKGYRSTRIKMVNSFIDTLPNEDKIKHEEAFKQSLGNSATYLADFAKFRWDSLLNSSRILEYWSNLSLPFPEFSDFAKEKGELDLEALKSRISELENSVNSK